MKIRYQTHVFVGDPDYDDVDFTRDRWAFKAGDVAQPGQRSQWKVFTRPGDRYGKADMWTLGDMLPGRMKSEMLGYFDRINSTLEIIETCADDGIIIGTSGLLSPDVVCVLAVLCNAWNVIKSRLEPKKMESSL